MTQSERTPFIADATPAEADLFREVLRAKDAGEETLVVTGDQEFIGQIRDIALQIEKMRRGSPGQEIRAILFTPPAQDAPHGERERVADSVIDLVGKVCFERE